MSVLALTRAPCSSYGTFTVEKSNFSQLPIDILKLIFDYVLAGQLRCARDYLQRIALIKVCKQWNQILTDPSLEKRFWSDFNPHLNGITTQKDARELFVKLIAIQERQTKEQKLADSALKKQIRNATIKKALFITSVLIIGGAGATATAWTPTEYVAPLIVVVSAMIIISTAALFYISRMTRENTLIKVNINH